LFFSSHSASAMAWIMTGTAIAGAICVMAAREAPPPGR
jgi:hypothetical protein